LKKYLIIVEERLNRPLFLTREGWLELPETPLPDNSYWSGTYVWRHTSSLIVRLRVSRRLALIKITSLKKVKEHAGQSLIEINLAGDNLPEVAKEAHNSYLQLMDELTAKRAYIYLEWENIDISFPPGSQ
jgi:hypothetical protein